MSSYVRAQMGLLKTQIALMRGAIATDKEHLFVPVANLDELKELQEAISKSRSSSASSIQPPAAQQNVNTSDQDAAFLPAIRSDRNGLGWLRGDVADLSGETPQESFPPIVAIDAERLPEPSFPFTGLRCQRPFFVLVSTAEISVDPALADTLTKLRRRLCARLRKRNKPEEVYWSAGVRNYTDPEKVQIRYSNRSGLCCKSGNSSRFERYDREIHRSAGINPDWDGVRDHL